MDQDISQKDIARITDSIVLRVESDYLIIKNRERCSMILNSSSKTKEDIIDALIYLHIILEVSLNGLFRNISLAGIKKGVDELEVIRNLDGINFIDKTTVFVYNSSFNFGGKLDQATEFHSILGKLKNFAGIRNQLLHGHAIVTINNSGAKSHTPLQKQLNDETLQRQVKDFKYILSGIKFYLECLVSSVSPEDKTHYSTRYLSYDFIPEDYPS